METKSCSEIEQHKLKLMKSIVHTQDPTSKVEVDDQILKRFLHVRKLDVDRASDSFLKYLKWIRVVAPNGSISKVDIPNELAQNKIFVQGFDKKGRPIAVVFFGRHVATKGKESLDELKRLMVYLLDKICARMPSGQEQFTCIGDLTGWGFSSSDLNGCLAIVSVLQDYYPKRLGQVYFLHQPYIFTTMWKIISAFIPHKTKKRIVFVENKKVTSTLLQDIDENELPEIYGGKISLVPIEDN